MEIQLPKEVEEIIGRLNEAGFEAYAVGGCVRDTLLGRVPGDWDITTSAMPMDVKHIFKRTVDTGIQHGTVTVLMHGTGYEVTTYRIDGEYEDGRHPKSVTFTSNLLEDLKRRDFTINAMAYSHISGIVDAFEGQQDLAEKRIRCVGNATERFTEDALRILRAVRFAGQLGFVIDLDTYQAMREIAPNLSHVSKERILTELLKLLNSAHPEHLLDVWDTNMASYITQDFPKIFSQTDRKELETCLLRIAQLPPRQHMRIAAVCSHLKPSEVKKILVDLKADNDTIKKSSVLVRLLDEPILTDKPSIRKKLSEVGPELFLDYLQVKYLLLHGPMDCEDKKCVWEQEKKLTEEILKDQDCISLQMLKVNGGDLIKAGMKPGKAMGEMLQELLEMVFQEPSKNDKEQLLEIVRERLENEK